MTERQYLPTAFDEDTVMDNLVGSVQINAEQAPTATNYLKLHQKGDFEGMLTYGPDLIPLESSILCMLDVDQFRHGWQLLDRLGVPKETKAVSIFAKLPEKPTPDWKLFYEGVFYAFRNLRDEEGAPFSVFSFTYGGASRGRAIFFGKIVRYIASRAAEGKKTKDYCLYPAMTLGVSEPYMSGYNKVYNPTCSIDLAGNKNLMAEIKKGGTYVAAG